MLRTHFPDFKRDFKRGQNQLEPAGVEANLNCQCLDDGGWLLTLTHIKGADVRFLLGREYGLDESLDLDSLIPEKYREAHHNFVSDILSKGIKSIHWDRLFNGMMGRALKIKTSSGDDRDVNISMMLDEENFIFGVFYCFKMHLVDKTSVNLVATKAGSITHDARGQTRDGISLVDQMLAKFVPENFISQEAHAALSCDLTHLKEILESNLLLFSDSRSDFLPEHIKFQLEQKDTGTNSVDLMETVHTCVKKFVEKQQARLKITHGDTRQLSYLESENPEDKALQLESNKIALLERFLINLIKNAIEANATVIDVQCSSVIRCDKKYLKCDVTDNGPGLPEALLDNFFSRPMKPSLLSSTSSSFRRTLEDIEKKRGEGTLMAYEKWRYAKGEAFVFERQDRRQGTTFCLFMPALQLDKKLETGLDGQKLAEARQFKRLILLVDDQLIILKGLERSLFAYQRLAYKTADTALGSLTQATWQEEGWVTDAMGEYGVICAANGLVAEEILKNLPIDALITDEQMPGLSGSDLIQAVRQFELKNQKALMPIALNSGDSVEELSSEKQAFLINADVTCLLKGNDQAKCHAFLEKILEAKIKHEACVS
ncbi:MAG: hybrid sensor histidine kinase/response regulator [Legionellaceae bacterium]|nr:hybrid sensor histidine kinase/response regulator [Legionellaceae bacterium]